MEHTETDKLRILISGTLPPPIGGIGIYFQSLLSSSLPVKVNLQFVQTSTNNRELAQSGRATIANVLFALKDCTRFFRAVIAHRPQICHITTAFGLSFIKHSVCVGIARIFGSYVLLNPRCSIRALYFEKSIWWQWYFRQVIRLTNGVIGLSSEWKQVSQLVPDTTVYFLQNAINITPFLHIAQDRFENPRQDGDVNILYLGYLGQAKGSMDLLETAQLIDPEGTNIYFNLVGGELRLGALDHLHQGIVKANLGQTVRLHPPVTGEEKMDCFRNADIFVFPSYTEGLPIAVIEAMASGLPIVASNVGGLPDMVREGVNGLMVDPGRPDQLAAALLKVIKDKKIRQSMGECSAQIAREQYDIEQHVSKLINIYAQSI